LIVPGIVAFARQIAAENRENGKPQAVIGIDGRWKHRRNGSAHTLGMVEVGSGRVVDFKIAEKEIASGCGNQQRGNNGMKVEAKKRVVKKRGGDQKMMLAVATPDAKMANVIRKSRWNDTREYDANHTERRSTAILNNFRRRSDNC
jgi:hypothetical protein